jgi:subtilisin family serine protease
MEDNDPSDENFHGTHVSRHHLRRRQQQHRRMRYHVERQAAGHPGRLSHHGGSGYLQDDDCAAALMYAADMGADVINNELGRASYSKIIDDACRDAYDRGCILVAAAVTTPAIPSATPRAWPPPSPWAPWTAT